MIVSLAVVERMAYERNAVTIAPRVIYITVKFVDGVITLLRLNTHCTDVGIDSISDIPHHAVDILVSYCCFRLIKFHPSQLSRRGKFCLDRCIKRLLNLLFDICLIGFKHQSYCFKVFVTLQHPNRGPTCTMSIELCI